MFAKVFIAVNKQLTLLSSFLLVKPVIPVGPKRLLHPDPVPTEVARFPVRGVPVDLPPEGGVVRGVAGKHARETGEERAVRRRRLGAEEKWIVAQQPSFSMFKPSESQLSGIQGLYCSGIRISSRSKY